MRPLVVLFLVLGALGALLFALTTNSGTDRGEAERPLPVGQPTESARDAAELAQPAPLQDETVGAGAAEDTRQALKPIDEALGTSVAFGSIAGKVITEDGTPVDEAMVVLRNARPSPYGEDAYLLRKKGPPKVYARVETDERGEFRFDRLDPRKDWELVVTHEIYQKWVSDMSIPVPEGDVWPETVVVKPGHDTSGVVRDANTGQVVVGALLVADSPFARFGRKKRTAGRMESVTDESGAYVFHNVSSSPSAPRVLTITAPGYATQVHNNFAMLAYTPTQRRFTNKQETSKPTGRIKDFELLAATIIAGRVVGPDRRGLKDVEVEALNQSGALGSQGLAMTGGNGEFLIEGLAEGLYTVRVTATDFDAKPLQRIEGGATDVLIELFELAMVVGRVVSEDGSPISNFMVKARTANDFSLAYGTVGSRKQVKNSSDGRFELKGLPEGNYVIEGQADGYASCFSERFTATQGLVASDIVVRMNRGGSVTGRVLDAYTNVPLVGAKVSTVENDFVEGEIFDLFAGLDPTALTKKTVYTDSEGRYSVDVMTPGTYQVQLKAKGYSPRYVQEVVVVAGVVTQVPSELLIKGATISGTVYGRDRSTLPGASIQLYPVDAGDTLVHRLARADGTGHYLIGNMRPGIYTLTATRPNRGSGNPFEALGDMKQSEIKISIEDGKDYQFDLHMGPN